MINSALNLGIRQFASLPHTLYGAFAEVEHGTHLTELKSHFSERRTAALVYKLEKYMMQLVQIMHKVTELTDEYQKRYTEKWGK